MPAQEELFIQQQLFMGERLKDDYQSGYDRKAIVESIVIMTTSITQFLSYKYNMSPNMFKDRLFYLLLYVMYIYTKIDLKHEEKYHSFMEFPCDIINEILNSNSNSIEDIKNGLREFYFEDDSIVNDAIMSFTNK